MPGFPTFAPSPPIDPRLGQPALTADRVNSMLNIMLNAQNLVMPTQPTTSSSTTSIFPRIRAPEVVFNQN